MEIIGIGLNAVAVAAAENGIIGIGLNNVVDAAAEETQGQIGIATECCCRCRPPEKGTVKRHGLNAVGVPPNENGVFGIGLNAVVDAATEEGTIQALN